MKKKILLTIVCSAAICLTGALAACSETPHEHNWNEGEVTTPATCASTGVMTYSCTGCDETKTEVIPKTEHPYSEDWQHNADEHWHAVTCEHTGERVSVGVHDWDEGEITTPATCVSSGVITYSCKICSETKEEVIPETEHTYSAEWSKNADEHWHVTTCAEHGVEKVYVSAHDWDEGRVITQATCGEEGTVKYTCTVCGFTKNEKIQKLEHAHSDEWLYNAEKHWHVATCEHTGELVNYEDHDWGEGEIVSAATCIKTGLKKYTCICGATKTEVIEKTEHTYSTEWEKDADKHRHVCTTEGCNEISDEGAHNWDNGVITTAATCLTEGVKTFTCTDCGQTKTEVIEKTDHVYGTEWLFDDDVHYLVCTTEGCTAKKDEHAHTYGEWQRSEQTGLWYKYCSVCGYEYSASQFASEGKVTETVNQSDGTYLTYFTRSTGYYTFTFTCGVDLTVKIEYYDRTGVFYDPEYTITSVNNSFTVKLWDRSVACINVKTDAEQEVEFEVGATFSETMPQHTHSFATGWSTDSSYHWHPCTDPNCEEEADVGLHEFVNGVCTVCGYDSKAELTNG